MEVQRNKEIQTNCSSVLTSPTNGLQRLCERERFRSTHSTTLYIRGRRCQEPTCVACSYGTCRGKLNLFLLHSFSLLQKSLGGNLRFLELFRELSEEKHENITERNRCNVHQLERLLRKIQITTVNRYTRFQTESLQCVQS